MDQKVFIIHPYDKSTRFLEKIKKHILKDLKKNAHYYRIQPNEQSHQSCIAKIKIFSSSGLILFLGHGRSDCLCGAKGDFYNFLSDGQLEYECPEKYYYKENFIDLKNINIFKDKKVIALSCNSNDKIGKSAVKQGVKVFIGFGDLPTSVEELKEKGEENRSGVSLSKIVSALKTDINYIIKKSVVYSIKNEYTFFQFLDILRLITNQRIKHHLSFKSLNSRPIELRRLIANHLYSFKEDIKIFGDGKEKLN